MCERNGCIYLLYSKQPDATYNVYNPLGDSNMLSWNETIGRLIFIPPIAAKRLPKRISTSGHYWRGFNDGAAEVNGIWASTHK